MLEKWFRLSENNTTVRREVVGGLTTFLTVMYIMFTNSDILSKAGMPVNGVFAATALTAAVGTIVVALYANAPLAMAPGMGLNTMFAYTICVSMGYHWKEALAISFLSGIIHMIIMITPLRKSFVNAIPEQLRSASAVALGLFIAYTGIKNAGFLEFMVPAGQYTQISGGSIAANSSTIPSLIGRFTAAQAVAIIGLLIMIVLTAWEKKTGEKYAALSIGVIAATFIGIPLNVTGMSEISFANHAAFEDFGEVFFSFFGSPGLLSIFSDPGRIMNTVLMILILGTTSLLDSIVTVISIGRVDDVMLFDEKDMEKFSRKGSESKLDKTLIAGSVGCVLAPVLGTSTATVYVESVTGIMAGGRTGLTGLVVGIMFLLSTFLAGYYQIIPSEAVAPALILVGCSMASQIRHIQWRSFEKGFPAFMVILFNTLAYSILDGIAIGILCHVVIQTAVGKRRGVHPVLIIISALYIMIKLGENFLII